MSISGDGVKAIFCGYLEPPTQRKRTLDRVYKINDGEKRQNDTLAGFPTRPPVYDFSVSQRSFQKTIDTPQCFGRLRVMRILPQIIALLLLALPCTAEEPVEIPLDQIWSRSMPGTTFFFNALQGEPRDSPEKQQLSAISKHLRCLSSSEAAGPVFAVPVIGPSAIVEASSALIESKPAGLALNGPSTVVFFAHDGLRSVHIERVMLKDATLSIDYSLHRPGKRQVAFIPIPAISSQSLKIIINDPSEASDDDLRSICRSGNVELIAPRETLIGED